MSFLFNLYLFKNNVLLELTGKRSCFFLIDQTGSHESVDSPKNLSELNKIVDFYDNLDYKIVKKIRILVEEFDVNLLKKNIERLNCNVFSGKFEIKVEDVECLESYKGFLEQIYCYSDDVLDKEHYLNVSVFIDDYFLSERKLDRRDLLDIQVFLLAELKFLSEWMISV